MITKDIDVINKPILLNISRPENEGNIYFLLDEYQEMEIKKWCQVQS